MKFAVELKPFLKMIDLVGKKMPNARRTDQSLRLIAAQARVFVESNQTVAGVESLVLAEGQCALPLTKFLAVLKTYKNRQHLTFEVDAGGLRIGNFQMPVDSFSPQAQPPGKFQVFPAADLSVLFPDRKQPPEKPAAGASSAAIQAKPVICTQEGSLPIAEDEMYLVSEVIRFARRLCTLPKITPAQLAGLAHALFALERLPRITKGVHAEFTLALRFGSEDDYTEQWVACHMSEGCFNVGTVFVNFDKSVGSDHHTTTVYEVESGGYRSMEVGNENDWLQVFDWINLAHGLLDENRPEDLRLSVHDDSAPNCMATGDEK
jgi:hypothetical protein